VRTLLVTSRVTFVPRNYDDLVVGMAGCPQVAGLLELQNASPALGLKALGVAAIGAPRFGMALLRNLLGTSSTRREVAYDQEGKPTWRLATINDPAAHDLIRRYGFDLVINARTRFIYRDAVLGLPPLGCLNVHHGLLPRQRGTMCDLWALSEGAPAGFTVHAMTRRVDDGGIVCREVVSDGRDRDYLAYLARAARRERRVLTELLAEIEREGRVPLMSNEAPPGLRHRRNPGVREVFAMRRGGMLL
jgi:methionyl-tRNA formyltransferase